MQQFNAFAGSLAGAGLGYAISGEMTLNVLNLKDLSGGALGPTGLLEMRLGGKDGFSMGMGTGGTDISFGTVAGAMAGLKDAGKVAGEKNETVTANGARNVTLAGLMGAVTDGQKLALAVALAQEARRDGIVAEDNYLETRGAVLGHTEMAARMRDAGYNIAENPLIALDLAAYDYARSVGDMSLMDLYADMLYRSDGDYMDADWDFLKSALTGKLTEREAYSAKGYQTRGAILMAQGTADLVLGAALTPDLPLNGLLLMLSGGCRSVRGAGVLSFFPV